MARAPSAGRSSRMFSQQIRIARRPGQDGHLAPWPEMAELMSAQTRRELAEVMWTAGPTIESLAQILRKGEVIGRYPPPMRAQFGGPAAATHLSLVAEPLAQWLKEAGTIEARGAEAALTTSLRAAIAARNVSASLVAGSVRPWCTPPKWEVTATTALGSETQRILFEALPWVVRANPERYPFFLPQSGSEGFCCAHHAGPVQGRRLAVTHHPIVFKPPGGWPARSVQARPEAAALLAPAAGLDAINRRYCCWGWAGSAALLTNALPTIRAGAKCEPNPSLLARSEAVGGGLRSRYDVLLRHRYARIPAL